MAGEDLFPNFCASAFSHGLEEPAGSWHPGGLVRQQQVPLSQITFPEIA
jgi:hypothetical protein